MRKNRFVVLVLLVVAIAAIAGLSFTGCGRNSTDPVRTSRSASEDDDARLAIYAYTTLSNYMLSVEQSKPMFGVNGGVNYSIYRPTGWDSTFLPVSTPIQGLTILWLDTIYSHDYQGLDLSLVKFDQNIPATTPLRPVRVEWGEYKYGTLNIGIRGVRIPDSLRARPIPYDIREFDMEYANNGTDPRFLTGSGALSGVVTVKVDFTVNGSSISQSQSDTTTSHVSFDNVGSQVGDASVHMHLTANFPYYNPLTDINSFSRKPYVVDYDIASDGRGIATVTFGGQVRARISFLSRPYFYTGNYFIAFDNFQTARQITY